MWLFFSVSASEAAGLVSDFSTLLQPVATELKLVLLRERPKMLRGAGKNSGTLRFRAKMVRARTASLSEMSPVQRNETLLFHQDRFPNLSLENCGQMLSSDCCPSVSWFQNVSASQRRFGSGLVLEAGWG